MSQFFTTTTSGNLPPEVATEYVTDDSTTAIPSGNILNVQGSGGVATRANPDLSNNLQIYLTGNIPEYKQLTFADSPYSAVPQDDFFLSCDTTDGPIIILLPATPQDLTQFVIKDRVGNCPSDNIILQPQGVSTIDLQASYTFVDAFESLDIIFHDGNYESY